MIFTPPRDWKSFLNIDDERELNKILEKTAKHRGAYKNADEVKIAQLWCALIELRKENLILQKKLREIEDFFELISEKIRDHDKKDRELIKSLEQL